ncbi:MAG TPA: thiamine phosphate synthase [Candidatus Binataceae bacterium]|nr:thiamine phosphate synthase [Candidatus Binataceae bacterium]
MISLPSHFYAMVDPIAGHEPVDLAKTLLAAGAKILQLRMKRASARDFLAAAEAMAPLCRQHRALFIVNDRADIAKLAGADGVHLGQDDLPIEAARSVVSSQMIIGISTHRVEQAIAAERAGADYIGFGPMYAGGAKETRVGQGLEILRAVRAAIKIPIVAIGGITEGRVAEVLGAGADAVAIISDVVFAPEIESKVRAILSIAPER